MSAYENFRKSIEWAERNETDYTVARKAGRNILNEIDNRLEAIEKLQALLKDIPLQERDVVHEVGYPDEKGDVVGVTDVAGDPLYKVHIRHRNRTIAYYRDELELMERPTP